MDAETETALNAGSFGGDNEAIGIAAVLVAVPRRDGIDGGLPGDECRGAFPTCMAFGNPVDGGGEAEEVGMKAAFDDLRHVQADDHWLGAMRQPLLEVIADRSA